MLFRSEDLKIEHQNLDVKRESMEKEKESLNKSDAVALKRREAELITELNGQQKNLGEKPVSYTHLDVYKRQPDKSEKYMKTIVAFANTQGGKLIVGVDDKTHQIVGVENDVLFQMMDGIANAVSDSCVPQIIPCLLYTSLYRDNFSRWSCGAERDISKIYDPGSLGRNRSYD